jgi:hypothetical protein
MSRLPLARLPTGLSTLATTTLQDLEGLLAAFNEERRLMGERHAASEARATQLQAQVRTQLHGLRGGGVRSDRGA